jgi:hypothetical protein
MSAMPIGMGSGGARELPQIALDLSRASWHVTERKMFTRFLSHRVIMFVSLTAGTVWMKKQETSIQAESTQKLQMSCSGSGNDPVHPPGKANPKSNAASTS